MNSTDEENIHNNPDASAWAKHFKSFYSEADEELMTAWFAAAMMAAVDYKDKQGINEIDKLSERISELEAALRDLMGAVKHLDPCPGTYERAKKVLENDNG